MPVLNFGRNLDYRTRNHLNCWFAPLLIPSTASNTNEHLHLMMMDMPIVATAWLKSDVEQTIAHVSKIAVANEELPIRIQLALGPDREIDGLDGG